MAATKTEPVAEFRVWCERCCIRIAPNEERTVSRGKTYHASCHAKAFPRSLKANRKEV